jgi:hypothetical protein
MAVVHSTSLDLGATLKNYQNETDRIKFIRAYIDPVRFFLDGYFYVYDLDCVNIAHATQKDLQGQNLYNYDDSKGNYVIRMLESASKNGGGFVEYYWVNPSATTNDEQKRSATSDRFPGPTISLAAAFTRPIDRNIKWSLSQVQHLAGDKILESGTGK